MAAFGATCLVVAPITAEGSNSITYGTGVQVNHLRRCAITYNWDESKFYGDNALAEYYRHLNDADVEIETTELDAEIAVTMGLEKVKSAAATSTPTVYTLKTENGDPVGIGFIQCLIVDGDKIFRTIWLHKVSLRPNNETSSTKEETMAWGAPTVAGKAWPVILDASGEDQIRDFSEFETEAAALAWLKTKANIT